MTDAAAERWFANQTAGAPAALRSRAASFFARTGPGDLASRLADGGSAALVEATRDGAGRAAALDLLAADALITLALLRAAESEPLALGAVAAQLRIQAAAAL